jgi:putative ABC transport system permease protein
VLVNEAMVRRMAWDNPIGKKFIFGGGGPNPQEKHVVGVVKDYHQNSLYSVIEPLMIVLGKNNNYLFVRTKPGDIHEAMAAIEKTWREVHPNFPLEYKFLDQDFDSQYKSDEKRSQIFTAFSGLTIIIACLGLLGLASFTTQQRYKEIGVRKVIGANVNSLVMLVSKEFVLLVLIGTVIAFPFAWYVTNNWLQNFAYRIVLANEWLTFIVSALLAIAITMITIGYHVIRAASANPVKALRDE